MTLSFLFPIRNRWPLFEPTLRSFLLQADREQINYELLVLDDRGTDQLEMHCQQWKEALPIRYLRLDTDRLPFPVHRVDGANNPSAAMNVGIRQARGDRIVLTSPEVFHRKTTNLQNLADWPLAENEALIADVWDETWKDTEFQGWIAGGPRHRPLHFLAVYPRKALLEMGGFDERFMQGWGFEDNEFADRWVRWGGRYVFTGQEVVAEHQNHPRPDNPPGVTESAALYRLTQMEAAMTANDHEDWGSADLIVRQW